MTTINDFLRLLVTINLYSIRTLHYTRLYYTILQCPLKQVEKIPETAADISPYATSNFQVMGVTGKEQLQIFGRKSFRISS